MMPSKAPANRAAPAPVPNSQKERLRRRNSSGVRTSDSDRTDRNWLRVLWTFAPGTRRTRKYVVLFGGVPTNARAWSRDVKTYGVVVNARIPLVMAITSTF